MSNRITCQTFTWNMRHIRATDFGLVHPRNIAKFSTTLFCFGCQEDTGSSNILDEGCIHMRMG